jgi:hypothetical protein
MKSYKLLNIMNKRIIGYILFGLSCCMWLVPTVIGLFNLPNKESAVWITTAIVLGEVFFVLSIVLLGKEFLRKIKYFFKKSWNFLMLTFRKFLNSLRNK